MTAPPSPGAAVRHFQVSGTRLGRKLLTMRANWYRFWWAVYSNAPDSSKRTMDVVGACVALCLFAPLGCLIAVIIKLDGGPVLFRQTRVGYRGRLFDMYKFRSMRVDAEKMLDKLRAQNEKGQGITFKMKNDPRVTWIGRYIRKRSLDEFPQFWNVLVGDMSLVGPRPSLPSEAKLYKLEDRRRFESKPGITCLWQVGERNEGALEFGDRNEIDFKEQVSLDVRYIENRSFLKDIWLVCKTVVVMIRGTGA